MRYTGISPAPVTWSTDGSFTQVVEEPGHLLLTDDSNNRSAPADVTNVLTVTNVMISDNGTDYYCQTSGPVFLTVFGGELMKCYVCTYNYIATYVQR